jgi:hypothetical protein
MARSISNIRKKRGRGRPKIGAIPVLVRLLPDQAARLDKWRKALADSPGRPEAIRRLLDENLSSPSRAHGHGEAHKASEFAAKAIEGLVDKSRSASEHARAKRRLIHGPKEFRDIRADQPKRKG